MSRENLTYFTFCDTVFLMYEIYQNNTLINTYSSLEDARGSIIDTISGLFHPCDEEVVIKIGTDTYEYKGIRYKIVRI